MNQQRPQPPSLDSVSVVDISPLEQYLCNIPYGEENETVLKKASSFLTPFSSLQHELSWHVQFRVWLRSSSASPSFQQNNQVLLPLILSQLQACLLLYHHEDSSSSMLWDDVAEPTTTTSWKSDSMLQHWRTVRYFVHKDIKSRNLERQDQLDVQRIIQGIDQLVGYNKNDEKPPEHPLHVLFLLLNEYERNTNKKRWCSSNQPSAQRRPPSMRFCSWVASRVSQQQKNELDLQKLFGVIARVPQWRARRAIIVAGYPQELLHRACLSTASSSSMDLRRGQALLASYLRDTTSIPLVPVPTMTFGSNRTAVVKEYLLHAKGIPNVERLVLMLWEHHVRQKSILWAIKEFFSWFPVEPIRDCYQSLFQKELSNCNLQEIRRATDFVCALVGNELEEWKQVWSTEFCQTTLLPLAHEVFLGPRGALVGCAWFGAALDGCIKHSPQIIVACSPQLAWSTFLLSIHPVKDDADQASVYHQMRALHKECVPEDKVVLPPLSVYIDSVLKSASRTWPSDSSPWERHVLGTLDLYKDSDQVATEWIRGLSHFCKEEEEASMTSLMVSLHRQICLSLWGRGTRRVPLLPLSMLWCQERGTPEALLSTPPECLFGNQGDLASSFEALVSEYGTTRMYRKHIVSGLALSIPNSCTDATSARDALYQHLRQDVIACNGTGSSFFKSIQQALLTAPMALQWWEDLCAELVRNEVPVGSIVAIEDDSFELDDILSTETRKRPRDDPIEEPEDVAAHNDPIPPKARARTRESATSVIQKLWLNGATIESPEVNEKRGRDGDKVELVETSSFEDNDDEDDEILLL